MKTSLKNWLIGILVATSVFVLHQTLSLRAQNPPSQGALESSCLSSGASRVSRSRKSGAVRFVGAEPGRPIRHPRPPQAVASAETAARAYFEACGSLFDIPDPNELNLTDVSNVGGSRTVVRFQQLKAGIPVIGGESIVHLDAAGNVHAVIAKTMPNPGQNVPARAAVTAQAAAAAASAVVQKTYNSSGPLAVSTPELWFYDPDLLGPGGGPPTLVWRMEITTGSSPTLLRELVLVDANRGGVVLHFNQVETARNRQTFNANNGTALPGTLVCSEGDACLSPPTDSHAASAHLYAADTYNFYFTNFGRDSIDNAGQTLTSIVHYGTDYDNAYWDGSQMVFGDAYGFAMADDVIAHEFTHGVTESTSNLFYFYQSGAINESLSDVFGELMDLTNGHGNDASNVRWLMGEDVTGDGAIRSMQNPPMFNDPDKMTSSFYYTGSDDSGGVHTNSGINNKAAFLMADGGTFNGTTVNGIGLIKTGKIYYEVQTHLLTSGADYSDLSDALYQGCINLIGTAGITTNNCNEVRNATIAVEMKLQPIPGFNPDAPVCAAGTVPLNVFFDNLESGMGNFVASSGMGSVRWGYDALFAHSGMHSLYGNDFPGEVTDSWIDMTSSLILPPNAFLHFTHAFQFEGPNYDGGVVEYSTNGGATWIDAEPLFDTNGYRGSIDTGFGNPLAGRTAFIDDSHGYISSRLNLSSLAGQSVRFSWRMGLDDDGYKWGWWLDDIRIYTCSAKRRGQITSQ